MTTSKAQTIIISIMIVALAMETNMVTKLVNLTKIAFSGSGTSGTSSAPLGSIKPGANNSCPSGYAYQSASNMCVPLIAQNSLSNGSINYNPQGLPTVSA